MDWVNFSLATKLRFQESNLWMLLNAKLNKNCLRQHFRTLSLSEHLDERFFVFLSSAYGNTLLRICSNSHLRTEHLDNKEIVYSKTFFDRHFDEYLRFEGNRKMYFLFYSSLHQRFFGEDSQHCSAPHSGIYTNSRFSSHDKTFQNNLNNSSRSSLET